MVTIRDYMDKCDFVINNLVDEQKKVIMRNKVKIVTLNKMQFIDGFGSDDALLKNNNPIFTGFYRSGDMIGRRYDFFDTGAFYRGLNIKFEGKETFSIFSSGINTTPDKFDFFQGYRNLFGLDTESRRILNYEIIQPELMNYINRYL
jgi:hypothetical protein